MANRVGANFHPTLAKRGLTDVTMFGYESIPNVGDTFLGRDDRDTDGKYWQEAFWAGLGPAQQVPGIESPAPRDIPVISDPITGEFIKYMLGYEFLQEEADDDLYGVIRQVPGMLGESMAITEEIVKHALLVNGTTQTGGWQGKPLFANDHGLLKATNITVDNLLNSGGPSLAALQNIDEYGYNFVNDQGFPTPLMPVLMVTGRRNKRLWSQILGSNTEYNLGGTTVANPNVMNRFEDMRSIQIVETPYLDNPLDTYVFYQGYERHLKTKYKYSPRTQTYDKNEPRATVHIIEARFAVYWVNALRVVKIPA